MMIMGMIGNLKQISVEQLNKLLNNPDLVEETIFNEEEEDSLDLDKSWHGIHYLLNGEVWDGVEPLRFVIMGKEEIGEDFGYGPARYLTAEDVNAVAGVLKTIKTDDLRAKFDKTRFVEADIYPSIEWNEEDLEYLLQYYKELASYYITAANNGNAMLTYFT
jgi:hypothetical protein